ncbi:bifunctional 3-(3-hydroxy-phenyl)propionate/3-hydroxycinnamic acid hydroxylase [Gordonia sihwensis]|uniref:bifunctional 3-(3-hydroxy-phenyl)propionate/3-hydroxycinnamic acid hydroxylase MhpA n=1 Tax=Gordonia sihwensis TaxID=173559 RepID=UPI0005EF9DDF|nr:bifunctional 3-(3-hydroxy-phenyl)propionate/3-hydroxycinnamic acid hydroxylase [Gordonia sihwensis]KJR07706.1 3-(3-hydroxyphenyl)propionate hydroxylase [Gordonia sihwensis]
MTTDFDVAIVGYGPTGQVLASMLGRAGVRVAVFERWPSLYGLPRLTHIDGETARIIQAAGDVGFALRDAAPAANYEWRNGAGDLLVSIDWSGESCGFAAHYTMYQPDIELAVDTRARGYDGVEIHQGAEVTEIRQLADHVCLTVRTHTAEAARSDAQSVLRTVTATYVVGCDGANSQVREAAGIDRDDLGVDDRWLNIDTECLHPLGPEFAVSRQFCDPEQPNMFMPIGVKRQRFEVAVRPGDDAAEMSTEEFAWSWLRDKHGLGPNDVRILRHVIYTFSARTADTWRSGRLLLAGDAAHTMPPYMGQGACSGMRDGITLAWKLVQVLRGNARPDYLDTYETERRPHVEVIQRCAVELGRVANLKDPVKAAERDAAFARGEVPPLPPFPTITSGVAMAGDGPASLAGTLAPQFRVRMDSRVALLDDLVDWGFTLVADADPGTLLSADQLAFLDRIGTTVLTTAPGTDYSVGDVDGRYGQYLSAHGVNAFLSRPDFHLFGAATADALPSLVDELRASLASITAVPA